MTATVAGLYKDGTLELLEEPKGLRDGRVRVTIEQEPEVKPTNAPGNRRAFLGLPLEERRRILKEQADLMASHYEQAGEWREWLSGDIVEY